MLLFDELKQFNLATEFLLPHSAHKLAVAQRNGESSASISVVCEECGELLIDFLPESCESERTDPDHVKYEGHYDSGRDICYVEVFKPGKSPYPLQERQDIINHSPTGIAWGYAGSGPAQCALAILLDYLGDEERARATYQQFKFRVVAAFPSNSEWTLTGRQIEHALAALVARRRHSAR
jgi:hypothetical protein